MKTYKISIVITLLAVMTMMYSCGNGQKTGTKTGEKLEGTISISGAFALYPMTVKWAEEFKKLHPDVRIDISAGGAGKGMADALAGMIDLGMFSRGVTQIEIEQGAWYIAVTKDAVVPTMNANNPLAAMVKACGISNQTFTDIYVNQTITNWNQIPGLQATDQKLIVYNRSDACGAAEMWGKFLGKNQEGLNGIGVFGDPGIADAVKNDPNGIGFNNVIYAYDITSRKVFNGLDIIPIDLNSDNIISPDENFYGSLDEIMNAIATGKYPAPPARDLYFIAKGKPTNPVVNEFLRWILNEGQQYVGMAGYVTLSADKIASELDKLK
ncbi:MAG: PstS family phosphate ABC transporter substrate-binding protein [Bacteroidales bacterium]